METFSLASSSSSRPLLTAPPRNPRDLPPPSPRLPPLRSARRRCVVSALRRDGAPGRLPDAVAGVVKHGFASISSSGGNESSSVGTPQFPVSPPSSSIGSPLFWIGVGVAFSAFFSWVTNYLKKYAMQQAFKSMMGQMSTDKGPFTSSAAFPGQPFPFPTAPVSSPPPTQPTKPQPVATVDVTATKVEAVSSVSIPLKEEVDSNTESKKIAFVDVSPEEVSKASATEQFKPSKEDSWLNGSAISQETRQEPSDSSSSNGSQPGKPSILSVDALEKMMEDPTVQQMVYPYLPDGMRNPVTFKWILQNPQYRQQLQEMLDSMSGNEEWGKQIADSLKKFDLNSPEVKQQFGKPSILSVDALEKMMDDPTVQQMVYPYLPDGMRNPVTFKWMLQNPQYRQQLQEMLDSMSGNEELGKQIADSLKNFDLNSPEVKQQFGVSPDEIISKIMANPDIAMAFQNPRVQAAIMDCSENPLNIQKYLNDEEVMDVFHKISQLFPGVSVPF